MEYSFSENLSPNSVALLGSPLRQRMNLEMFTNNLFCKFLYKIKSWNCVESYILQLVCIYENPKVMSKQNKLAGYSDNDCPICDEWPHIKEPLRRWKIQADGVYVSQFNPLRVCKHFLKKGQFGINPYTWGLIDRIGDYFVSILNDLDHELMLVYGPVNGARTVTTLPSHLQREFENERTT